VDHHDLGREQVQQEAPEPEARAELRALQFSQPSAGQVPSLSNYILAEKFWVK
jgi:hypothetical protein